MNSHSTVRRSRLKDAASRKATVLSACLAVTAAVAGFPPAVRAKLPVEQKFHIGRLQPAGLIESSGIVASRTHRNVFWTHNDSGSGPEIFAVNLEGKGVRQYVVDGKNDDWEDIALDDKGRLLIADIGNNAHDRKAVQVHRLPEPDPTAPLPPGKQKSLKIEQTWTLKYPAAPFDAESLFVRGDKGYLVSKLLTLGKADLYSFDLDPAKPVQALQAVGELPIRFPVTGADMTADGKRLVVMTVAGPYLFSDVPADLSTLAKADPTHVTFTRQSMEACCFVAEGVVATTEEREMFLFRWKDFGVEPPR